jgi:DNA invertase Pin-like site-specific DNA recombinase
LIKLLSNLCTKLLTKANNNQQKSLAGIKLARQQGKHLGRPAGRDAEKVVKVAKALSMAEIVTLTGISRLSVKHYRQELAAE